MRVNKQRVCNALRKHYPEIFGIRRKMQAAKVRRVCRHMLSRYEVEICENDPSQKAKIIAPYLKKYKRYLAPVVEEMESMIANAPKYQSVKDLDALRTDMLFCRLAYGFIPSEYTGFAFEEKGPEERKEYVSDIDMDVFGYSVDKITTIQTILDKAESFKQFKDYFKRDVIIIEKKSDYDEFCRFVSSHPIFVKKKVFSSMGNGVELVDISQKGETKGYFDSLIKEGKFLLEERVMQSPEMARFNESSVNTVRCITFRTSEGIVVPWTFMRCGRGGAFVDNGGQGGVLLNVDPEDGVITTDAYSEYNECFEKHPDTGIIFKGNRLPAWAELISICTSIAEKYEGMEFLSFDLAYTDKGWIIIEVNEVGQFIGPQIVLKKGIKKELWSYFTKMKNYCRG